MGLTVNTNIASINAQRNLNLTQVSLNKSLQRLSSGLRINSAADDAAGLAISEGMRANIRSMNQAIRNANDGVSLVQVAEGAMNEVSSILTRMRELTTQAQNGTVSSAQRQYISKEFTDLHAEITRISNATDFNGKKLLNTSASVVKIQVGVGNKGYDGICVDLRTGMSAGKLSVASTISTIGKASTMITKLDAAINKVSQRRANLGAVQNRLQSVINNLQVSMENTSAAESRIRDTDVAAETAQLTRGQILMQAGTAILSQANQLPQTALSLLR